MNYIPACINKGKISCEKSFKNHIIKGGGESPLMLGIFFVPLVFNYVAAVLITLLKIYIATDG